MRDGSNQQLGAGDLGRLLNEAGAEGWELVSLVPEGTLLGDPTMLKYRAVFMRRAQP